MRQLSGDDATFLYADTEHANANITLVLIYDPSGAPRGRLRFKGLLDLVASRLHLSPLFRNRLLRVPLDLDVPYWVEDDRFDLEYHVRHIALPEPGDWRQFCIQASRIHARPLDLSRPLWELYLVDRLDAVADLPRDSFALLLKAHHAALHGQEGADVAMLLHDLNVDAPPPPPPEPWFPASEPAMSEVALRALRHNLGSPLGSRPIARALTRLAPRMIRIVSDAIRHPEDYPIARFNAEVSPHRVFETRRFEARQFEQIRRLVRGATLDDAVLAVCGGALRRYLAFHEELPADSLVALTPPAVHGTTAGPEDWESALRRVTLATDVASPVARLRAIQRTNALLRDQGPDPAEPGAAAKRHEHAPAAVLALAARALSAAAPAAGRGVTIANCTIVNAPGPTQMLYLGGSLMTYFAAMTPVADGLGLTIAVTSYEGRILMSPTACREQLPDPEFFAQCLRDEFEALLALSARRRQPPPRRTRPRPAAAARAGR